MFILQRALPVEMLEVHGFSHKALYYGAAILIFSHSKQCNQTKVRKKSLVPFLYKEYKHRLLLLDTGNQSRLLKLSTGS